MKSTHTPGPWIYLPSEDLRTGPSLVGFRNRNGKGSFFPVAEIKQQFPIEAEQAEANALLIHAAPDLLEACKFALQYIREGLMPYAPAQEALEKAITLATTPKPTP